MAAESSDRTTKPGDVSSKETASLSLGKSAPVRFSNFSVRVGWLRFVSPRRRSPFAAACSRLSEALPERSAIPRHESH